MVSRLTLRDCAKTMVFFWSWYRKGIKPASGFISTRRVIHDYSFQILPLGLSMTRAVDERILGHQECIPDSHLSLSAPVETAETAHVSPTSSTRRQIVNKINCLAALPGGHNGINPPNTGLTLSTMETDKQLCSTTQTFTALPLNAGRSEVCEMSQARKIRDWGLTVAFNYPSVLPLQRPGLGNVLQTPLIQAGPLIDWSMSLITKTNYSVPFPSSWSP